MPAHVSIAQYGNSYTQPGGGVTTCTNAVDTGSGTSASIHAGCYVTGSETIGTGY